MKTPTQRGARARTSTRAPTIDLVSLVELLAKSIKTKEDVEGLPASWPLFAAAADNKRLSVNMRGVMSRFFQQDKFDSVFSPGDETGFIRDAVLPPKGVEAKIGGRILTERVQDLSHAVGTLKRTIDETLDEFMRARHLQLVDLVSTDANTYLELLSNSVGTKFNPNTLESSITPLQFAPPRRSSDARNGDVARLIAAVEEVEMRDWLDSFEKPARRKLLRRGLDEDEVDGAIDNFRREAQKLDSQTVRFLNFLDDEALSRVRLEITFAIMRSIREAARKRSDEGARLLVRFIDNVDRVKQKYFESEEQLTLDVSSRFGSAGKVNVSEYLRKALFYKCLSVWPEWMAQMFEFRPIGSGSLAREVSYRFRVNGINPAVGKSSFANRVANFRNDLVAEPGSEPMIKRLLAELLFLSGVVPRRDKLDEDVDPLAVIDQCVTYLSSETKADPVSRLIDRLEHEATTMDLIADGLVQTLRTRGEAIVSKSGQQIEELSVCVQEDVVDWDRLASATGTSSDFFVRPAEAGQDEKSMWFKHIVVTGNPSTVSNLLFSVKVKTLLRERALTKTGAEKAYSLQLHRELEGAVLPVVFRPFKARREGDAWVWESQAAVTGWRDNVGIDFEVDEAVLGRRGRVEGKSEDLLQQQHAASTTAFAVLAHTVLWTIRERIATERQGDVPRLLLIRAQNEGKQPDSDDPEKGLSGSEGLYAITQALELALACEGSTFMQGFALDNASRFRDDGVFAALVSAFPLAIGCASANDVPKIGLINYSTRPCSAHPNYPQEDAFLYTAKTYIADSIAEPVAGQVLREDRTQLHIQPKGGFEEPSLIFEEIGRLRDMGCHHVMLLWQHYGNRRIGRTADRHAPHSKPEFLERVAERFPEITLYSLRRDVFPATRMPKDGAPTNAFEVARVREHEEFWHPAEQEVRRDIVPIYTFATLVVVGEESDRPQSGFCTYFLELDSRLSKVEWAERARANLIDPNRSSAVRPALISVLRGLHYLHAERGAQKGMLKPKLDPHHWIAPSSIGGAGELKVMRSRRKGALVMSFPAVLAQVSSVLRGGKQ